MGDLTGWTAVSVCCTCVLHVYLVAFYRIEMVFLTASFDPSSLIPAFC